MITFSRPLALAIGVIMSQLHFVSAKGGTTVPPQRGETSLED
ncbi:hypothetical protein BVG79_p1000163 (plasmid) [Ketogulonicigenium robustum]|uniref:Uncharacterized protein n=1 Tax=Ketogulonicigenium robustum TaxID=92947 RepID=A0A1W6P387_9RHOB|nr:hypothetical protein BVG79_p1000163 [Ketogulonicigenium robustum]